MPSTAGVKKGFGLLPGTQLQPGLQIADSAVHHVVVKEYERYKFPITLELQAAASTTSKSVEQALADHCKPRIVYSEYGSPYDVTLQVHAVKAAGEGSWTVTAEAVAVRNRELPTQAQMHASAEDPTEPELTELRGKGHRVLKSHFSTGHCATCGEGITVGDYISQAPSAAKRSTGGDEGGGSAGHHGSWSHARCALQELVGHAGASSSSGGSSGGGGGGRSGSRGRGRGRARAAAAAKGGAGVPTEPAEEATTTSASTVSSDGASRSRRASSKGATKASPRGRSAASSTSKTTGGRKRKAAEL